MEEIVMVFHGRAQQYDDRENILCCFCFDDFMWPSGDRLPLRKTLMWRVILSTLNVAEELPGTKMIFSDDTTA